MRAKEKFSFNVQIHSKWKWEIAKNSKWISHTLAIARKFERIPFCRKILDKTFVGHYNEKIFYCAVIFLWIVPIDMRILLKAVYLSSLGSEDFDYALASFTYACSPKFGKEIANTTAKLIFQLRLNCPGSSHLEELKNAHDGIRRMPFEDEVWNIWQANIDGTNRYVRSIL